jgi:hypothetical protein
VTGQNDALGGTAWCLAPGASTVRQSAVTLDVDGFSGTNCAWSATGAIRIEGPSGEEIGHFRVAGPGPGTMEVDVDGVGAAITNGRNVMRTCTTPDLPADFTSLTGGFSSTSTCVAEPFAQMSFGQFTWSGVAACASRSPALGSTHASGSFIGDICAVGAMSGSMSLPNRDQIPFDILWSTGVGAITRNERPIGVAVAAPSASVACDQANLTLVLWV